MKGFLNFLSPRTIAVIGASDHVGKVGEILMRKALASNCNIIPVNPGHDKLFGIDCYSSILQYKEQVDLAVIAVPKKFVSFSLEECGKKGIKNVILISAGFSESGDKNSELKLIDIAKKYGIRIIGPNCFGVFNPSINLDLTFAKTTPSKGSVAFISQSGALWSYLSDIGLGFSGFVGLGNMMDLEFNDFIEYFSKDKGTKKIVLYIEKLKNGLKFIEICKKAIKNGKRIYAIKTGASEEGARASFSHTASLASDYAIYKGVFKQAGVIFCNTLEEAFGISKSRNLRKLQKNNLGKRVSIITNAGGAGALASDYLSSKGFEIIKNRDLLGTALASDYELALKENPFCDWILLIVTPQSMTNVLEIAEVIVNASKNGKRIIPLFLGRTSFLISKDIFKKNKIEFFDNFTDFISFL